MNLKKFALCVIGMFIAVMLSNTEAAYAEEAFNTEEVIVQEVVPVEEMTVTSEAPSEKPVKNIRKRTKKVRAGAEGEDDYSKADLRLMSAIIYCEANMEPYAGKVGVGIVVMNRVRSSSFPSTIKGVIYQRGQFSPVRNGSLKKALERYDAGKFTSDREKQCIKAAKAALGGQKSVTYKGKTKDMGKYKYFSGYLGNAKYKLAGHMFK